jgi:hypothetical protein
MPTNNLDPHELLSLVEGEILGEEVADERLPKKRIRELRKIIRSDPSLRVQYAELRASVEALHGLAFCDAPASVWHHLESAYDDTANAWTRGISPLESAGTTAPRGRLVFLDRLTGRAARSRKIWVAAACLLVVLAAGLLVTRGFQSPTHPESDRILFVRGQPVPATVPPGVAIAGFQTRVLKRYQGVSPELIRKLLDTPVADK